MNTSNRMYRTTGALLLALALIAGLVFTGVQFWASAAPGAAPARQVPLAEMAELTPADCTLVDTTRSCELWAVPGAITMPGGVAVGVWGFATSAAGPALVPGPVIHANAGETLEITLHNEIAQNVSLGFPGQALAPDLVGIPQGGSQTYTVANLTPGAFLYEAGMTADGARQVAMGLFGPLIVGDPLTTGWDQEVVLVFSEIDPAFNANPVNFSLYKFKPKYWLINGQAFPDTGWIGVNSDTTILMRYLNAGVETQSIGLLGLNQQVMAVDGKPLPFPAGATAVSLAAGETKDALVAVPASAAAGEVFSIYHGSLHQHNNNQRLTDMRAAFGGMLAFLQVTGEAPPPPPAGPVASNVAVSPDRTDGSVDVTFSATLTDDNTNVVAYEYWVDAGTATAENVAVPEPSVNVSVIFPAAEVGAWATGDYTLYIRGQDADGNWGEPGSAVLTVDKDGPVVSNVAAAPNPTDGSVDVAVTADADDSLTGNSNVAAGQYRINGGDWIAMTVDTPGAPVTTLSATILAADVLALGEGDHTVEVQAQDELGNWGDPASTTLSVVFTPVDTTAPIVTNVLLSPGTVDLGALVPVNVSAQVDDTQSNIAGAEAFIDAVGTPGSGYQMAASDGLFDSLSEGVTVDIPAADLAALSAGDHIVFVLGVDGAGNWSDAAWATLTVTGQPADTTGPVVTNLVADPNPTGKAKNVTLTATATDAESNIAQAMWFLGTDPATATLNPMSAVDGAFDELTEDLTVKININKWATGTYLVSVYARDAAGNWGPVATIELVIGN